MAIIATNILSTQEYLEIYPADEAVENDIIQSAINDATMTLDGVCGGMIAKVWNVIDPEDPLFRTEQEHNLIKQAHAIQAHEGVSRSLDFTGGSESYTSGSNNYNQSRTTPGIVADDIIYQLLAQARVYNPNITTDTKVGDIQGVRTYYDPSYDPTEEPISQKVADLRYIHKHAEIEGAYDKFLKYDTNGNITYVDIGQIVEDEYYTKQEIDAMLANYMTEGQVDAKLASYYNADEIDTMFALYYTKTDIDGFLADYYTQAQVNALLNDKQNRLTAGTNINISQVGDELVISATTEPIASYSFADLTGSPYDSSALGQALNSKATTNDLTAETLARSNADTSLGNRIGTAETAIEGLDTNKQNITDNTLTTTDKTIVGAINEVNAKVPETQPHLYRHCIEMSVQDATSTWVIIEIYNNSSQDLTFTDIYNYVNNSLNLRPFVMTGTINISTGDIVRLPCVLIRGYNDLQVAYTSNGTDVDLYINNTTTLNQKTHQIF